MERTIRTSSARNNHLHAKHRLDARQFANAFLHSLTAVTLVVAVIGALYIPFDRWRATQRRHVTVLDCNLPTTDAKLVSLVRIQSEHMKAGAQPRLTLIDLHNQRGTHEFPWSGASPACITTSHAEQRLFVGAADGDIYSLARDQCGDRRVLVARHAGARPEELAVSPSGQILVSRGFRTFHAWNLTNGALAWSRHDIDSNAFAICSNATLVCGLNSGEIIELSLTTGKTLRLLARHKTNIRHVAAAADSLVAVDGAGHVVLFRRQSGLWSPRPSNKLCSGNNRLALSADGKQAVGTSRCNTALICWDLDTQEPICRMTGHAGIIINAGFLPDGSLLSCGNDGTVRIWDLAANGALRLVTRVSPLFAG
jgi:hypothetical protein